MNKVYDSISISCATSLFLLGRLAFRRHDAELMMAMLCGLLVWLPVEAFFSLYLGVFFIVGVDVAVLALFSIPLITGIRRIRKTSADNESSNPQSPTSGRTHRD